MESKGESIAYQMKITGIVQGVGFRPHVYRLASEHRVTGWVLNSSSGVLLEVEGDPEAVRRFSRRVVEEAPPLAVIRGCEMREIPRRGFDDFAIRHSESEAEKTAMISPDIAICPDCRREVRDPRDRRYNYPFTNCTNCGPRFTIIKNVPYDRDKTTMAPFAMCPRCEKEYMDPGQRRFHAQPNACPVCGPHTMLVDASGGLVRETPAALLKAGYILAVKGLGAFHLAVDATNPEAVKKLRRRKKRDAKPFAVMARDPETVHCYCRLSDEEARWLASPQAPIVVLQRKPEEPLPDETLHPGLSTLGVMLPYTPLHYLLFDEELRLLVMTSANISDEPLIIDNQEALEKLVEVADYFLVHNREIFNPCDDSVMRVTGIGTPHFIRRARGLVPLGLRLPFKTRPVLALGGELKNTFCITREDEAFLSQHWGDLNHYRNYCSFLEGIPRFQKMLAVKPLIIAHDQHPDYVTTRWAREQKGKERVGVQHHHAHLAACMAENGLTGEVLGVICDGTGWGTDGAIWGGEILKGDYRQFTRLAHLKYVPLPGGDLSIKRPYRMAMVYLQEAMGEEGLELAERYLPVLGSEEKQLLVSQIGRGFKVIPTSSMGRLFDAAASFMGICSYNGYEGQAAMELEEAVENGASGRYSFEVTRDSDRWVMDVLPLWCELARDLQQGKRPGLMAAKFHRTLVEMILHTLLRLREETGLNRVVLSGGVFHNQVILVQLTRELAEHGFVPYQHCQVPTGDGGISLGQALIASVTTSELWGG